MKRLFAALFSRLRSSVCIPTWAVDVQMGFDGNLVFEPAEVSVAAGEPIHFVNNMSPLTTSSLRTTPNCHMTVWL